jgi:CubicO group peptidase (beta-lactamase class C family)
MDPSQRSKARTRAAITGSWAAALWCCDAAAAAVPDLARMERAVEQRASAGQFMGSVLVARDGRVLLSKGYGEADLDWKIPNSPTTKFRLGSITKQFTAANSASRIRLRNPSPMHLPPGIRSRSSIC